MSQLAPEIQTGGASESLYGGAVRVRRGRRRRGGAEDIENMGRGKRKKTPTVPFDPSPADPVLAKLASRAVVPSPKDSRTYTLVKTVMSLMFAKDGGEYKIPEDTFRVKNETESNCTATKKAWAKAVKANFTTPTDDTIADLGIAQRAFAECMYNAIIKARGTGTDNQQELAEMLAAAESRDDEGVQMIDNQISFIMSLNVGFMPSQLSDEEGMVGGGEDDDDEDFGQMGGMNDGGVSGSTRRASSSPASSTAGSGPASAPAPAPASALVVPQSVLVQVAGAPSLQGQLAIAQQAQGGAAAGAAAAGAGGPAASAVIAAPQAPNVSYELAAAAFRLFLSPFRSCYRSLPEASSITARLNSAAEAVENRRDILPATVAVSTAAAGLLMPGAVGGALTGAANTLDAVNSVIPSGLSILTGAAGNAAAVGSLAVSAGRLGASAASVYVASRAVGALTNTGVRCAAGAAQLAASGVARAGDAVVGVIEEAPGMALAASAPAISAAASAAGPALMAAPGRIASAAGSAGRRAGEAVRSAFAGIRGGGGGGSGEQIERLAIANADAVEAVMDAPDEVAAMEAAAAGGASVRAAISAAGGSGAYAKSAGNAIARRLNVLAGRKRSRAELARAPAPAPGAGAGAAPGPDAPPGEEEADAGAPPGAGAVEEEAGEGSDGKSEEAPPATRPRLSSEGGCPTCGSHGGSRKKRRSKAKKSRKQKKRASYRRRHRKHSKSRSPSEEIYASPPAPVAITLPRMESSGPPVRS